MKNKLGKINGLFPPEAQEFLNNINKVEGVECSHYVQESVGGVIEFKSIMAPIVISFFTGVASGIVANVIYDFLKKKESEGKKISISIENLNIYQNDNKGEIENKINTIIKN
ncbi:MAG TPA: hypothetical protein ENH46_07030 [Candidatus Pacearchaeota archaeon]|nr:hypothetical protein [Candidatus Pacearchaeota archaeon]